MESMYDTHNTIRFGTAGTMADIQAYYDAVELGGFEPYCIPSMDVGLSECDRSIVSQYEPVSTKDSVNPTPQFQWMARSIDTFKKGNAHVNEQWYLENQVLLVVHLLASKCVDWKHRAEDNADECYSLEKLCKAINLDLNKAKRVISHGFIKPTWPTPEIIPAYSPALAGDGATKKESRQGNHKARRKSGSSSSKRELYKGPADEYPGWIVQEVQRATSYHIDKHWSHPELPGILVRSRNGVTTLIDYTKAKNVSVKTAYEKQQNTSRAAARRSKKAAHKQQTESAEQQHEAG